MSNTDKSARNKKNYHISKNSSTFAADLRKKMVLLTSDNTHYPELKEKRHETRRESTSDY